MWTDVKVLYGAAAILSGKMSSLQVAMVHYHTLSLQLLACILNVAEMATCPEEV